MVATSAKVVAAIDQAGVLRSLRSGPGDSSREEE
jgi:hypothetical protein